MLRISPDGGRVGADGRWTGIASDTFFFFFSKATSATNHVKDKMTGTFY